MQVSEIMTRDLITVTKDLGTRELAEIFIAHNISGAPVVDENGNYLGVVLEEGLIYQDKNVHIPTFMSLSVSFLPLGLGHFEEELKKIAAATAGELIESNTLTVNSCTTVEDVATMMVEKGQHFFPVLDDGRLAGVVTKKDIVRAIAAGKLH